jgi:hypothetical protein
MDTEEIRRLDEFEICQLQEEAGAFSRRRLARARATAGPGSYLSQKISFVREAKRELNLDVRVRRQMANRGE